jgi:hypothetical protein
MLDAGVRPARLLVEVTPVFLNESGAGRLSEEAWLTGKNLSRDDLPRAQPYLERPDRLARDWLNAHLLAGYSYRAGWCDQLLAAGPGSYRRREAMDPRGWAPFRAAAVPPRDRRHLAYLSLKQYETGFRDYRLGTRPEGALRDLLARCRREGIPPVLLLMPESHSFRCRIGASGVAAVQTLLADLSLSGGFEVIDARAWVPDELFWDAHHLGRDGAAAFTRRLRTELGRKFQGTEDGSEVPQF